MLTINNTYNIYKSKIVVNTNEYNLFYQQILLNIHLRIFEVFQLLNY